MKLRIKGNKGALASVIAIVFALFMDNLVFGRLLGFRNDVLEIIFFIIMFVPLRGMLGTKLGEDRSQAERDYAELDAKLRTKPKKKDEEEDV